MIHIEDLKIFRRIGRKVNPDKKCRMKLDQGKGAEEKRNYCRLRNEDYLGILVRSIKSNLTQGLAEIFQPVWAVPANSSNWSDVSKIFLEFCKQQQQKKLQLQQQHF